ncbi:hypothetical protein EXIGLDRAFT_627443 [Exidia glandulosa HHB12029]|uniref:DM2 domain-containing protein n=1 Tax=Exidia glandulosa HHB12029 TaxID=1314781 RepID=A0A165ZFA0_EXIGL|nr:hypothetical protein EXIGLDRAFT_627443 [Exidia glandulosa HHB12029]
MTRKLAEISDALARTPTVTRTLRVFLSHSVSGQSWQEAAAPLQDGASMEVESGQAIPAWTFRVEGRLLDVGSATSRQNKTPARKFSSFVKRLVVDWDQDPNVYAQPNMVEWQRGPGVTEQDGFEVKRRGDQDVNVRVLIQLQHTPERFALAPELERVLDIHEDTRTNIITALWNYIKINSLQDKVDRKLIRADADLRPIFNADTVNFHDLPQLINRFLQPPPPITLNYTLTVGPTAPSGMQAFDIDIETEDVSLKARQSAVVLSMTSESAKGLAALDDEIASTAQAVRNAQQKRDFLLRFAEDPARFVESWLASQSRDLEVILGNDHGVKDEDLKRSDFFRLPWVEEAVAVQEGLRVANALQPPPGR